MKIKDKIIKALLEKYREIYLLGRINALLSWDLNVNLPPKASEGRASQSAYLTKLIAEKWLDSEFRNLLEKAIIKQKSLKTEERAIVRNLNWAGKYYLNVPKKVIIDFAQTSSRAFMVWQKAKTDDKFKDFLPHLKKLISLNREIAEHLGYKDNPYDALLDLYEPGLTSKICKGIFDKLQPELTRVLARIQKSENYKDSSELTEEKNYPIEVQKQLSIFVLKRMGYDFGAGRMDISSHPFTDTLDRWDVRITNRYKLSDFRESLMVAMHEGGHALYELGVDGIYAGTPLDGGVSLGIHESQSRFWENQVGRSESFLKFMTPVFQAFYPSELSKIDSEGIFRLFNQVKPSLIRTEADEVTYNLHIMLRFELEEVMINGRVMADDLPEIWRQKMKKYLEIVPETDREGVLQDVHWSHGPMGYFPTYTLGNLYAAQFTARMKKEINIADFCEKGELGVILSWLRANIHRYGSLYWPDELAQKATGEALNPRYFLEYIKEKYSKIYEVSL